MTDEARIRLLSGVWVSPLVFAEIRLAQKEGRRYDARGMIRAARWGRIALWLAVREHNQRRRRWLTYR